MEKGLKLTRNGHVLQCTHYTEKSKRSKEWQKILPDKSHVLREQDILQRVQGVQRLTENVRNGELVACTAHGTRQRLTVIP